MGEARQVETRTATVTLRPDGIVVAVAREGSHTTRDDAEENLAAARTLSAGKPFRFLVDASADGTTVDAPARRYYMSDEGWGAMTALAMVIESKLAQPLVDVLLRVCSRQVPMRAFVARQDALQWLQREFPPQPTAPDGFVPRPSTQAQAISAAMMDDVEALEGDEEVEAVDAASVDGASPAPAGPGADEPGSRSSKLQRLVERAEQLADELEATAAARDFLESVLQTMADAVVVVGPDGMISLVNEGATRLTGYETMQLLGHDLAFIFQGQESLPVNLVELNERHRVTGIDGFVTAEDGSRIPVLIHGSVIPSTDCTFGPFVLVIRDVTEQRRAEEAIRRHRAELERKVEERTFLLRQVNEHLEMQKADLEAANRELLDFSHVVSHDIRAPLRAVRQYADFLTADLGDRLEGDPRLYLAELERAVSQAETLVEDLLALARVGRPATPVTSVDLGDCVRAALGSLSLGPDVALTVPPSWPSIEVDPILFQQTLRNLVSNAVKFNVAERKEVELSWRVEGASVVIEVRDNGIGIPPRHQQRIFGTFERLHTEEEYEGTGIGLAIAKKAMDKLGGSIEVDSTEGEGSTFRLALPLRGGR